MLSLTPDLDYRPEFTDSVTYKSDFDAKYSDLFSQDSADFRIYIYTNGIPTLAPSKSN